MYKTNIIALGMRRRGKNKLETLNLNHFQQLYDKIQSRIKDFVINKCSNILIRAESVRVFLKVANRAIL